MSARPRGTVEERLMAKVDKTTVVGCWLWTGYTYNGYGRFTIGVGRTAQKAHRVAYEILVGPLDAATVLHHRCENTRCINPAHLEPMTPADHAKLGVSPPAQNGRKTHCSKGHAYTPENTIQHGPKESPSKWRMCRTCRYEHNVRRAARRKAERHAKRAAA